MNTKEVEKISISAAEFDGHVVIKQERMPDGKVKLILKDKASGKITQRITEE